MRLPIQNGLSGGPKRGCKNGLTVAISHVVLPQVSGRSRFEVKRLDLVLGYVYSLSLFTLFNVLLVVGH
jgi:hypothetical protein